MVKFGKSLSMSPEERVRIDQVKREFAQRASELASKALEAVQELIRHDQAAQAEAGIEYSLFGDEEKSLEDAEMAINVVRVRAKRVLD